MKRKLFAWIMTIVMIVSLLPTSALAAEVGDISTTEPTQTPEGMEWETEINYTCGEEEHSHSSACRLDCQRNHRHDSDCYGSENLCGLEEHDHESAGCASTTLWTLVYAHPGDDYRYWWPVFWDFDRNSSVEDESVVTVTANGQNMMYADGVVAARDALLADTTDVYDAIKGITVELAEGYYVSRYRLVCGNHYTCSVTPYSEGVVTENTADNYTATLYFEPNTSTNGTNDFDHGALPGNHPVNAPDPNSNNLYRYDSSQNVLYPAYLMLEISEDTNYYDITYEWGTLSSGISTAVPYGEEDVRNGHVHTVKSPAEAAIAEARLAGYEFAGWKVVSDGFADGIVVQPSDEVAVHRADIALVAQWKLIEKFNVTYVYEGDVPASAPAVPVDSASYAAGETVTVKATPEAVTGYSFEGWKKDGSVAARFDMPAADVTLVGTWSKTAETQKLSYKVEYYFDRVHDSSKDMTVTKDVWVGTNLVPVDVTADGIIKDFTGWEYHGVTDPEIIPSEIENGGVIKVYYTKENPQIAIDKSVDKTTAEVGDTLIYTITVTNSGGEALDEVIMDSPNGANTEGIKNIKLNGEPIAVGDYERRNETFNGITTPIDEFTVDIPAGGKVTISYEYTVVEADAGKTLRNVAFHSDDDGNSSDTVDVEVADRYTLTVYHYADGTLVESKTFETKLTEGDDWTVAVGGEGATYNAPTAITVDSVNYTYDAAATAAVEGNALSGTDIKADAVVHLHYAKDVIGTEDPDKPDNVPDKYQATILYEAETGGKIVGLTKEVVTIIDGENYATHGKVTVSGSKAEEEGEAFFEGKWTWGLQGHAANVVAGLTAIEFANYESPTVVQAEKTYVFTACFEIEVEGLAIHKTVNAYTAEVGDYLLYEVRVTNTGNVELKNVVVSDILENAAGSIELSEEAPLRAGVSFDEESSSFTISSIPAGDVVHIEYHYRVQADDAGKTILNTAVTRIPGDATPIVDSTEVEVEEYETDLDVTKTLDKITRGSDVIYDGTQAEIPLVRAGDVIKWKIVIEHVYGKDIVLNSENIEDILKTGNSAADDVELDIMKGATIVSGIGDTITLSASYTVPEGMEGRKLMNTVTVASEEPAESEPVYVNPRLETNKTVVSIGGVAPEFKDGSIVTKASVGDEIIWKIVIKHEGAAITVPISDKLEGVDAAASQLKLYTDEACENELADSKYSFAESPTETSLALYAKYVVTEDDLGSSLINTVSVNNNVPDEAPAVPVESEGKLVAEKFVSKIVRGGEEIYSGTGDIPMAKVGDTIYWSVVLSNSGETAVTVNLSEIKDILKDADENIIVAAKALYNANITMTVNPDGTDTLVNIYSYTVTESDKGKTLVNWLQLPNEDEQKSDDEITVADPSVSITKTADKSSVKVGDKITYTITVTNTGNMALDNVVISDTFADGGSGKLEIKSGKLDVGTLAVGKSASVVLEYTTVSDDINGLSNVAVVNGDPGTPDDPDDDVKEETPKVTVEVEKKPDPTPNPKPSLNLKDHMAYIIGYPDETVRPQNNITRAEVATIFFRLLDESSRAAYWSKTNDFNDVSASAWYNNAISTLANAGIISGYPDGGFHPNAAITRAEFATIAARFSDVVYEGDSTFTDVPEKHWAAGFISLAEYLGWVNGYPDGSFKPDQLITRAEAMTLTNRVLERATKEAQMHKDMVKWSDNISGTWYYEAVQEATNSHEYYRLNEKVENHSFNYEKWTKALPAPDWSALEKEWSQAGDQ